MHRLLTATALVLACSPPARTASTYVDPCVDLDMREQECALPDGRHGWCGARKCDDICGPNATYTHISSKCVKPCGAGCKTCNRDYGFCTDGGKYGSDP